jgi:hypothetical protein
MCKSIDTHKYPSSFSAFILDQDAWEEMIRREGKDAGVEYTVPEHGVISIRFPEAYRKNAPKVRVFVEKTEEENV